MIKLFGFIYINPLMPVVAVVFYFAKNLDILLATYVVMLIHELSHLIAALICREKVKRIFIMPYGFELRINMPQMKNELFISAAGPFFSLFLSIFFLIITQKNFFCTNFFLFLINIFPAVPLDGGRILKLVLWNCCGAVKGNVYIRRISTVISVCFFLIGILLMNLWLVMVSVTIFTRCRFVSASPFYKKRVFPVPDKIFKVSEDTPLTSLLHRFSPYYIALFKNELSDIIVSEDEIISSLLHGNYTTFGDLLTAKSAG